VPGDIAGLQPGYQRYTQFTNDAGGILDDLMVTSTGDHLLLVINADCKDADLAHIQAHLSDRCEIEPMFSRGLIALQGPLAAEVLARFAPAVATMKFMTGAFVVIDGVRCYVTRSGYTGGDGYEISTPAEAAEAIARKLLAAPEVKPIGLGARDSLRLEAGLPLYGHDLDLKTTPVTAGLTFAINKRRRAEGGFPGAMRILAELENGPIEKRVGFEVAGRQPVREGALVLDGEGNEVGRITSGGFSPSLQRPIAMGYVGSHVAETGTALKLEQRGKLFDARIVPMPFVPHRYHRKGAA
jgi:aminomethyltransferase